MSTNPTNDGIFGYNPPDPIRVKDLNYTWRWMRWKGRTDLFWLMKNLLGNQYNGVHEPVHRPLISHVQQFPMTWEENCELDVVNEKEKWQNRFDFWRPNKDRKKLGGTRRRLILDGRSSGKTTLNAKAHTIQWLLNYPDIAILIVQANIQKAEDILHGIKEVFLSNDLFRKTYPEFVPWGPRAIKEFGNRSRFVLPNRRQKDRSEPSVMVASIDGSTAGYHCEVIKFSDIVDEQNSITDTGLAQVKNKFAVSENVLVDPDDWIDVEGTRYHGNDLYGKIIQDERELPVERREWIIFARGVYKPKMPVDPATGQPMEQTYIPEELDLPFARDDQGMPISFWPERWSVAKLENERQKNDAVFACQKLNNPSQVRDKTFSWDKCRKISREDFRKVPVAYRTVTVDTAETISLRSDFTVLTCVAWDGNGRGYVEEIRRDKFLPDQIVDNIFQMHVRHKPLHFKIEETSFVRGLKPSLFREREKRGIYPVFDFLKRDTQQSKVDRIKLTLQPMLSSGDLIFVVDDEDPNIEHLKKELEDFPKGNHDDILDTLADQFQNREWFGRNKMRPTAETVIKEAEFAKYVLGVDDREVTNSRDLTGGL